MKLVLGLAALALAFGLAAFWQDELRASLRGARAQERAALGLAPFEGAAGRELAGGWSRLTVGRPSGREALWPVAGEAAQVDEPERLPPQQPHEDAAAPPPAPSSPSPSARPELAPPSSSALHDAAAPANPAAKSALSAVPAAASGSKLVVERGQTLHSIAKARYGRADAALVAALAKHNGLSDPAQLAVGQVLALPSLASLLALPRD